MASEQATSALPSRDQEVSISIKCPTPGVADFQVKLPLSSTILNVKEEVAENHPLKPPVTSQKLIFCGRLLANESELREVLRQVLKQREKELSNRLSTTFLLSKLSI